MSLNMSFLEVNKILASIIVALIAVGIISYFADVIFSFNEKDQKANAYKIEIIEPNNQETQSNENLLASIEPISSMLKNASYDKGEKIYKKCGTCHNYEKGSANKIGPQLWDLINRPKANVDGYAYSEALANFGGTWDFEELSLFLYKPKDYIEGTKMNFSGLKKAEDRADLILFLRNQSDNLVPLP
tara:strand:+ start:1410 stop:1970 length:561 start_codon:yes stop_codon:yes gene_type:complete